MNEYLMLGLVGVVVLVVGLGTSFLSKAISGKKDKPS